MNFFNQCMKNDMKFLKHILILLLIFLSCGLYAQDKFLYTTIEFVVNTDNIIYNEGYEYYINTIIPEIKNNLYRLDKILIIGSASPEGNKAKNIELIHKRADKIYSYISTFVSKDKIVVNNDYDLFISKTKANKEDYPKLRAAYIEIVFKKIEEPKTVFVEKHDTILIEKHDTTYFSKTDTLIIERNVETRNKDKLVLSVYNSLSEDLLKRPNIGVEFYFNQMSFFIDGSFSGNKFFGKNYDIYYWHTGLRKYFNDNYNKMFIELYGRTGYFDTDLFVKDDNGVFGVFFGGGVGIGYKFNICKHWKITPLIRFGFDDFKFNYYYSNNSAGVDVSFNQYINGKSSSEKINNENEIINQEGNTIYVSDKTINKNFYNNAYNMYWFGPTYIGVTIQRDFYIHKKKNKND